MCFFLTISSFLRMLKVFNRKLKEEIFRRVKETLYRTIRLYLECWFPVCWVMFSRFRTLWVLICLVFATFWWALLSCPGFRMDWKCSLRNWLRAWVAEFWLKRPLGWWKLVRKLAFREWNCADFTLNSCFWSLSRTMLKSFRTLYIRNMLNFWTITELIWLIRKSIMMLLLIRWKGNRLKLFLLSFWRLMKYNLEKCSWIW